ncbi:MAG: HlyC/CorC family transporter [Chloroflexi bacterium]|nr:MAG: HlyC/CorC family transporter [Chloroflexota bacterium]
MNAEDVAGLGVLVLGTLAFILVVAAEAGVIVSVRERALKEPAESRLDALRRFYQERQLTLSSLALARNLARVGVTAVAAFLVFNEAGDNWAALVVTTLILVLVVMLLQAFPRMVVARNPERWQRILKPFVSFIRLAFRGPVMLLDTPIGVLTRSWPTPESSRTGQVEELILLSELDQASAGLQEDEREMIRGVMEMEFRAVREVMVPRTDIVAADVKQGFEKVAQVMVEHGYSRVPVYEGNIDNIIGIAYAKDVLKHLAKGNRQPELSNVTRPAHFVPESKKVHEMLAEMKQRQISIAILVDEYGGTAGLVTIEDLLEEIVGEIRDEFDLEEQPVQLLTTTEAIVDGRVGIDELNEMFDVAIQKEDFDSIGGFIVNELGRMPSVGDQVGVDGIRLKVLSVNGRRIKKVRVTKVPEAPEGAIADA